MARTSSSVSKRLHVGSGHSQRAGNRRDEPGGGAPQRNELLDPPAGDVGKTEQTQCLGGRGGIDHDDVVVIVLRVFTQPEQAGPLLQAGDDGHFFGDDILRPALGKEGDHEFLEAAPILVNRIVDVDLLGV
jgi:hypothetical protein